MRPISPEVAKKFLEDYYYKLELRTVQKISQLTRKKKRTTSFNQVDLQRNKLLSGRNHVLDDAGVHNRRMSVDVGLLLGQTKTPPL